MFVAKLHENLARINCRASSTTCTASDAQYGFEALQPGPESRHGASTIVQFAGSNSGE